MTSSGGTRARWVELGLMLGLLLGGCTGGQSGTPAGNKAPVDGGASGPSLDDGGMPTPSSGDAGCQPDLSEVEAMRDRITGRYSGEGTWVERSDADAGYVHDATTGYELDVEEAGNIWRTRHGFEAPVRVTLRTQDERMELDLAGAFRVRTCGDELMIAFGADEPGGGFAAWKSGETGLWVRHPDEEDLLLQTHPSEGVFP